MRFPFPSDFSDDRLEQLVLLALREAPATGYDLIKRLSRGPAELPASLVYPHLALLEDQGLVMQAQEGDLKRYSLTEAGHARAAALAEAPDEEAYGELAEAFAGWGGASACGGRGWGHHHHHHHHAHGFWGRGARRGGLGGLFERWSHLSPEQREKLKAILKRTKQEIKETLAG